MKITVNRHQYGIGQGCFHTQRISVKFPEFEEQEYRFVYDCGSDTEASDKKLSPYLDWAIKHLSGSTTKPKVAVKIDTFYLSHFHADHISGLLKLSDLTDIKEIVIPYIDRKLLVSLVMQHLALGKISESTDETIRYFRILENFTGDGSFLNEDIRITRIPTSPEIQDSDLLEESEWHVPQDFGEITSYSIEPLQERDFITGNTRYSRLLQIKVHTTTAAAPNLYTFWEIRTWSYRESVSVTNEISTKLSAIKDSAGNSKLPNLIKGKIDPTEIQWAIDNLIDIQKAYKDGLIAAGVLDIKNHNAVSLCLYSGPKSLQPSNTSYRTSLGNYRTTKRWNSQEPWRNVHGWLGTGDAQLGIPKIWGSFYANFSYRIALCCTILMPHHGSSKGKNHNPKLLQHEHVNAVFSAGAFNQWQHPNLQVLESISDSKGIPITVTEKFRPGFFETIIYSFDKL